MNPAIAAIAVILVVVCGCGEASPVGERTKSAIAAPNKDRSLPVASEDSPFVIPDTVSSDFVGSVACRACHAATCDEFALHPMGRSMTLNASPETLSTVHPSFTTKAGLNYEIASTADGIVHHEKLSDEHGQLVFDRSEKVDFGIGSGQRGRGFGFQKAGRLYLSPVTWYSRSARWDLSPGYDPANNPGFERKASDGCMACHAGRMATVDGERDQFRAGIFLEASIGCERCHGPGSQHVQFQHTKSGRDQIVNPTDLSPAQRDAVCFQCHLQGERRVVRYGRTNYDFRAGMNLSDVWVTFLKSGSAAGSQVGAVSQVEQMLSSRCYQRSNGELGCISCHDPHSVPADQEQTTFYRDRCLNCHGTAAGRSCRLAESGPERTSRGDSCISCHMPRLAASDVPHTAQTDHRIARKPDESPSVFEAHADLTTAELPSVFGEVGYSIPPHELVRAQIILIAEKSTGPRDRGAAQRALELLRSLEATATDDADLFEAVGLLYETLGQPEKAAEYWQNALAVRPRDEALLELLATMHHTAGKMPQAREFYRQLIESNNSRPTYYGRYAHVLGQTGRMAEGIEAAKMALRLNPGLPQAHGWLAEAYGVLGDRDLARYHQQQAEEQSRVRRLKSQIVPKSGAIQ